MSDPGDDKVLQEYLSGNSPLSQRYRELGGGMVPPHLDELILKQSRDAVAAVPQVVPIEQSRLRQSRRRLMRWSVPATIAASTVLVVSIVLESGNRHQVTAPLATRAAPEVAENRAGSEAPPATDHFDTVAEPQSSAAPAPSSDKRSQKVAPSIGVQKSAGAAAPIQAPKESDEVANAAAKRVQAPPRDATSPIAVSGALAQPATVAPTSVPAAPAPSGSVSEAESKAVSGLEAARRERSSADAADSQRSPELDLQEAVVTGSRVNRPARALAGPRETITQNSAPAARSDLMKDEAQWRSQPQTWLEHIRQLRKHGAGDEADVQWKQFRAAYPDYPVAETDAARAKN